MQHVVEDNRVSEQTTFPKKGCPTQPESCALCARAARHWRSLPALNQLFLSQASLPCSAPHRNAWHRDFVWGWVYSRAKQGKYSYIPSLQSIIQREWGGGRGIGTFRIDFFFPEIKWGVFFSVE